jgi:predicted RNA-binding protein with PUA-like domain
MAYWLMKSEPAVFSLDDLIRRPHQTEHWDGVRNYQARNYLRAMRKGDLAFFYHSNCPEPAVVGIVEIAREAYPDFTAFDPKSQYYDPKSSPERPRWFMVDVRFKARLPRPVTLNEIKAERALSELPLVQRGSRLSVMPVSAAQWQHILALAARRPSAPLSADPLHASPCRSERQPAAPQRERCTPRQPRKKR